MNRLAPTLPTACGSLPPEGAAAPAARQSRFRGPGSPGEDAPAPALLPKVSLPPEGAAPPADWQSQIRGRNLDERGQARAPFEAVGISVSPADLESQIRGRNLNERGRRVPCLKL